MQFETTATSANATVLAPRTQSQSRSRRRSVARTVRPLHVGSFVALLSFCFAATSYKLPLQEVAMIAAGGILVLGMLLQGHRLLLGGRPGVLMLLFGIFVALSVPMSVWLGPSIAGAQTYAKFMIIFLVAVNTLTTRRRIWWLLAIMTVLVALYPGLGGVRFYLAGTTKAVGRANWVGLWGNANMLALTMLMFIPFAIGLFTISKRQRWSKVWRVVWLASIIVMLAAVILSKSRAGFLALTGLGVVGFILAPRKDFALGGLGAGVVLVAVFGILSKCDSDAVGCEDFGARMQTIFAEERGYSASSREILWANAVQIALSYPITGTGINTFERVNAMTAPAALGRAGGQRYQDTHNTFLNIWAEVGTPALFVFTGAIATLILASFRAMRRVDRRDPLVPFLRAGVLAMATFAIVGWFNSFQNAWFFYLLFGTLVATIGLLEAERRAPGSDHTMPFERAPRTASVEHRSSGAREPGSRQGTQVGYRRSRLGPHTRRTFRTQ